MDPWILTYTGRQFLPLDPTLAKETFLARFEHLGGKR